jgi:hypothetical protein
VRCGLSAGAQEIKNGTSVAPKSPIIPASNNLESGAHQFIIGPIFFLFQGRHCRGSWAPHATVAN